MKIKIKEITEGCMPEIFEIGDWIDLKTAKEIVLKAPQAHRLHNYKDTDGKVRDVDFDSCLIPLGVAMEIPEGFEGHLLVRSSTFKKWGILQSNSKGIIDNSYKGDNDQWMLPIVATRAITIPKGERIAQFRVVLTQKATAIQKIKWLFDNKIEFEKVETLNNVDRKGIGEGTKNK